MLPALGIVFNVFEMTQLSLLAWIRLLIMTILISFGYAYKLYSNNDNSSHDGDRKDVEEDINSPLLAASNVSGSLN